MPKHQPAYAALGDCVRSYLSLTDMLDSEVEPDSEAWIACVWPDEEVELKLTDVVHSAEISYTPKIHF